MIKKLTAVLSSKEGFSLVEILASVVLLALLVGPFLTMFVQSAKTNQVTRNVDDATFVANSQMDYFYNIISNHSSANSSFASSLNSDSYQTVTCTSGGTMCFNKQVTNHYVVIQLTDKSSMEDVLVKVYKTSALNQLQAQMESVYAWGN